MAKHKPHGDPVFFGHMPSTKGAVIVDTRPKAGDLGSATGRIVDRLPPRFIGAGMRTDDGAHSGTLIPVAEFRPLVKRLIDRGELNPRDVDATVRKLSEIATKLIPEHSVNPIPEFEEATLEHGNHLSPLIAVKQKCGYCFDWAAVFTAMARSAGLKTEIEGDPEFFRHLGYSRAVAHVWPVVTAPDGSRIKVIGDRTVRGMDRWAAGPVEQQLRVSHGILTGNHYRYDEHTPIVPVVVPMELKVDRPDVFG